MARLGDRWAEWEEMQIQVSLAVGEQAPRGTGTAEEGKQVPGDHQTSGVHSACARKDRKNHFPIFSAAVPESSEWS